MDDASSTHGRIRSRTTTTLKLFKTPSKRHLQKTTQGLDQDDQLFIPPRISSRPGTANTSASALPSDAEDQTNAEEKATEVPAVPALPHRRPSFPRQLSQDSVFVEPGTSRATSAPSGRPMATPLGASSAGREATRAAEYAGAAMYGQVLLVGVDPTTMYQQIQDLSAKRISTLDYLKKTHQGQIFWFNTLLFTKADLSRLPGMGPKKLARRASNFLMLGLSLPSVIDLSTGSAIDYLRTLNSLLIEFEDYERMHPVDGVVASTFARARIPSVFKRSATSRTRRTSSATDITLPMQASDFSDSKSISGVSLANTNTASLGTRELEPGDDYLLLRNPSIPFDPDFFEIFVSLCDIVIECYIRITTLVSSPAVCAPDLGDMFAKTDGRLKKVIFEGIVKDFVELTKAGARYEIGGISKVVLGGLM